MYNFYQPTIDNIDWLKKIVKESQPLSCEYSVGNLLGWCWHYDAHIAEIDGCLVSKIEKNNLFGFPKGDNYKKALLSIKDAYDYPSFYGLVESEKSKLMEIFPGEYEFYESRDSFDYIYLVDDLATLEGKKYHSKRNHISYFEKTFNWSYEEINKDNLNECVEMNKKWYDMNVDKDKDGIEIESEVINFCFKNYDELNCLGGLIRIDGEVVAFTFGEKLNETTFDTHFEKAYSDVRGAYPIINREFSKNTLKNFEYVNREDDVGSEGLRKAKLSYQPAILLKKYTAVKL